MLSLFNRSDRIPQIFISHYSLFIPGLSGLGYPYVIHIPQKNNPDGPHNCQAVELDKQ
ncbi:hypothetical protein D1AOALGA4SA_338 [Olavius algarvensis Delta 1 endosymbiont]|nr:hypothetical protein D1AOALGA4SA_338 [Olavius algarvensis Delta 1 endosymbiont]